MRLRFFLPAASGAGTRPIPLALHTRSIRPIPLRSIRARFALFRCAPYGLYAGYVLGLAPLRAYAVGYGHSALFRLRSIRAPYASAIVRALKRRARNALAIQDNPKLTSFHLCPTRSRFF